MASSVSLGQLRIQIAPDTKGFRADVKAEAEAAGQEAGSRFGDVFSRAAKVGGLAVAGIGAILTGHLIEMDSAMARFRSETGATEAEVKSANSAMETAYRQTLLSVDDLGETLGALRTDMGLSQDEANAMLVPFAKFAEVTGQTGHDAVLAFDDILDNWNLTAEDAVGIMDQLTLSHQKFGGSVTDNEATLAALAPAMKAANFEIDDGVALLNLFGAKGLDAEVASAAFAKALTKVKSPEELKFAIENIANTKDGFQRAAAAAELFGARAGAKLGNALAGAHLDDYRVSVEDAAGTTDKAADDIQNSITNKIKVAVRDLIGGMADLVGPAAPFITALPVVVSGIKAVGTALDVASFGAAAKWAALLGPLGLATLALIGLKGAYDQQAEAGRKLAAEGGGGFDAVNSSLAEYNRQLAILEQNRAAVGEEKFHAALVQLQADYANVLSQIKPTSDAIGGLGTTVATTGQTFGQAADDMAGGWSSGTTAVIQSGTDMDDALLGQFHGIQEQARFAGEHIPRNLAQGITTSRQEPLDAFEKLVEMLKHPMTETAETARLVGQLTGKQLAAGLASADPDIRRQAQATKQTILDRLADIEPSAGTMSKKAMVALAAGMQSKDADVRNAATGIYQIVQSQLALKDAKLWAQHAGDAYAAGLASKETTIAVAASAALRGARSVFAAASPPGPASPLHLIDVWGERTGLAWVDGLIESLKDAPGKVKLTLADVQKAFADFVARYNPIGSLFGGQTPEADRAALVGYIQSLEQSLPTLTDPTERLATLRKIIEYRERLAALDGKVATEDQKQAETLQRYIDNLDKALLTETDPKRIAAMTAELELYVGRLDRLLAPKPIPSGAPDPLDVKENLLELQKLDLEHQRALLAATPELEKQNAVEIKIIDAKLAQIDADLDGIEYQRERNRLLLIQLNLQRQAAGLNPLPALPPADGGVGLAVPAPVATTSRVGADPTVRGVVNPSPTSRSDASATIGGPTIIVNNPAPEPASRSVVDVLKLQAAFGR